MATLMDQIHYHLKTLKKVELRFPIHHCPREKLLSSAKVTNYLSSYEAIYINCNCSFFITATVYDFEEIVI